MNIVYLGFFSLGLLIFSYCYLFLCLEKDDFGYDGLSILNVFGCATTIGLFIWIFFLEYEFSLKLDKIFFTLIPYIFIGCLLIWKKRSWIVNKVRGRMEEKYEKKLEYLQEKINSFEKDFEKYKKTGRYRMISR